MWRVDLWRRGGGGGVSEEQMIVVVFTSPLKVKRFTQIQVKFYVQCFPATGSRGGGELRRYNH